MKVVVVEAVVMVEVEVVQVTVEVMVIGALVVEAMMVEKAVMSRELKTCPHKNLYMFVQSSITYNSQKVKIQMTINKRMDKQNVLSI